MPWNAPSRVGAKGPGFPAARKRRCDHDDHDDDDRGPTRSGSTHLWWTRWQAPGRLVTPLSFAARNFSQTCDFTTVRGEKPPGRDGVAAGHDRLFRTAYRYTTLRALVTGIRPVCSVSPAVNAESTIVGADETPLASTHALAIVERTAADDAWHITAFHNMVLVALAAYRWVALSTPGAEGTYYCHLQAQTAHLAIVVRDPERLAAFYGDIFRQRRRRRRRRRTAPAAGGDAVGYEPLRLPCRRHRGHLRRAVAKGADKPR